MFNNSYNTANIKVNAISGTLVKNYKKSFFTRFQLCSVESSRLLQESPKMYKRSMDRDMPVVLIQCMLAGGKSNDEVIAEVMWKEDFDKISENEEEAT